MTRRLGLWIGLVVLLGLLSAPLTHAQEEKKAIVQGYLFYLPTCDDCTEVRETVIPPLYRQYGQQLQIMAIDVSDPANYEWWQACEKKYGVDQSQADVPEVFIGQDYLVGPEAIRARLPSLVSQYMQGGGVDYPAVPRPAGSPQPTVRFIFFFSPTCPHCQYIEENIFPALKAKYGERVQWEAYSTEETVNYEALLLLEEVAELPSAQRGGVPMIFIGDEFSAYHLLIGSIEIPNYLPSVVDWSMSIGGVGLPGWKDELFAIASMPMPSQTPDSQGTPGPTSTQTLPSQGTPGPASAPAIHLAYFTEAGCSECDRVTNHLRYLERKFPNLALVVHEFDIMDEQDLKINLCLSERLGVPENQRHDAPAVFVGSDFLVDEDITPDSLTEIVTRYAQTGAEATWETCEQEQIELPPPPPWWAVILPGLIDGINPCAFATIIFFVSYLALIERKGREIIMVGVSFVLAVFLSYLGFGMLLREILAGLVDLVGPILRPILNSLMALLCLVLAVLSLGDFRKARRGRTRDMALRLPDRLRKWINTTIRQSMKSQTLITAAFVAGVVVSFIELACTGQVYVPIIQGLSNPDYRLQSTIGLIVYCLAFIVPLIAVFIVSYLGTSSQKLGLVLNRYTASIKLLTAFMFLFIGFWLIYDILRIWGVISPLKL